MRTFFLDHDGVCVDFHGAVRKLFGRRDLTNKDFTTYRIEGTLGVSADDLWRKIDGEGPWFWRDLETFWWFGYLYEELKKHGDVYFATQPSWSYHSYAGKKMWFDKTFGPEFRGLIYASAKHLLAGPDRVLIDDNPDHCRRFAKAGGKAVLFPQPWNGCSEIVGPAMIDEVIAKALSQ